MTMNGRNVGDDCVSREIKAALIGRFRLAVVPLLFAASLDLRIYLSLITLHYYDNDEHQDQIMHRDEN